MPNTQTAGGTSAQPYGMYLPMPAAGHHNMIHQPIHQVTFFNNLLKCHIIKIIKKRSIKLVFVVACSCE